MTHVRILLGTLNGARFLDEQLLSYLAQDHQSWDLTVSDDGSSDGTHAALERFEAMYPNRVSVVSRGPAAGFSRNFLSLLGRQSCSDADIFMFSDQDDVWLPTKMSRALGLLRACPSGPQLVLGRTIIVDAAGKSLALSRSFREPPSFANALVQNIGGGNTMAFNAETLALVQRAGCDRAVISHDWWLYQLVTGAGGTVIYDPTPTVLYRQHGQNTLGANSGIGPLLRRVGSVRNGTYRRWNDVNLKALSEVQDLLTPENRARLKAFEQTRRGSVFRRLRALRESGVRRQGRLGRAGLTGACALGWI